jgi:aminopeptidase YwaD
MNITFDSQRVMEHIRYLSEGIGPRFSGSKEDRRATDYIQGYFKDLGLEVSEQPFKMISGAVTSHGMQVLEPDIGEIPCHPLVFSSGKGSIDLEGEVAFLEGFEEPQVGPHLKGKIVIWTWPDSMEAFSSYQKLARQEPLAVVLLTPTPGVQPLHLQMPAQLQEPYLRVPTFFITWEDGLRLFRMRAEKARLHVEVEQRDGETRNIIAELQGSDYPDEIILIGGHHDSVLNVPGAMDNAAGTATVMELARLYARRGSRRTLRFVAWGAEEFGLWGSKQYLKELQVKDKIEREKEGFRKEIDKTELDKHLFVISLDVLGVALSKDVCFVLGTEDINALLQHLSKEMGLPHGVKSGYYGTDSLPFSHLGIPSLSYASVEGAAVKLMHTPADNLEIIDPDHLQRSGEFIDTFLQRSITGAKTWPFRREVPEELKKEIEQAEKPLEWIFGKYDLEETGKA